MQKLIEYVGIFFLALMVTATTALLLSIPIKWCWNYAVAPTLHLPEVGFLQAWCLLFIAGNFFKATLNCKHDCKK